jgi:hypothetical protein
MLQHPKYVKKKSFSFAVLKSKHGLRQEQACVNVMNVKKLLKKVLSLYLSFDFEKERQLIPPTLHMFTRMSVPITRMIVQMNDVKITQSGIVW